MFRDTSEELARLEAELLAEEELPEEDYEEPIPEENFYETEYYEDDPEDGDGQDTLRYRVYNTDITDEDLAEYAEEVRSARRRGCSTALVIVLCLLTLSIVALVALILRRGGFL